MELCEIVHCYVIFYPLSACSLYPPLSVVVVAKSLLVLRCCAVQVLWGCHGVQRPLLLRPLTSHTDGFPRTRLLGANLSIGQLWVMYVGTLGLPMWLYSLAEVVLGALCPAIPHPPSSRPFSPPPHSSSLLPTSLPFGCHGAVRGCALLVFHLIQHQSVNFHFCCGCC